MIRTTTAVAVALALAVGCTPPPPKQVQLSTNPQGAVVQVNGTALGPAPLTHPLDFNGDTKVYKVSASLPGYYDATKEVRSDSPELEAHLVELVLQSDLAYAATVSSDAANQWVYVQADPKLPKDVVWQKIVSVVTDRYTHLTSLDATSGHLESATYQRDFATPAKGPMTVRTQLVAAISSQQPLVYKVKLVSQVGYGGTPPASDYPRVYPEDAKLIDTLRAQVGVQQPAAAAD